MLTDSNAIVAAALRLHSMEFLQQKQTLAESFDTYP